MQPIRTAIAVSVLALTPCGGLAQAQQPPADPIVVEAERPHSHEEVKALARAVGGEIDLFRPIARFDTPLCLDVAGLKDEFLGIFVRRVNENARRAGVRIATGRCRPNAMVLIADDSRRQLSDLRRRNRFLFGEMPRSDFKTMLASRDGVYAWKINQMTGLGMPFDPNGTNVAVNRTLEVGRLNPPIRIVTNSSAVVIERSRIEGKTIEQLADYATMRLIAPTSELAAEDAAGPSTIMTLFSDPANAPQGLTAFDRAFLESVYDIRANGPSAFVFVDTAKAVTAQAVSAEDAP